MICYNVVCCGLRWLNCLLQLLVVVIVGGLRWAMWLCLVVGVGFNCYYYGCVVLFSFVGLTCSWCMLFCMFYKFCYLR